MLTSEIVDLLRQSLAVGTFEMFQALVNCLPPDSDFSSPGTQGVTLMSHATDTANSTLINFLKGT